MPGNRESFDYAIPIIEEHIARREAKEKQDEDLKQGALPLTLKITADPCLCMCDFCDILIASQK